MILQIYMVWLGMAVSLLPTLLAAPANNLVLGGGHAWGGGTARVALDNRMLGKFQLFAMK